MMTSPDDDAVRSLRPEVERDNGPGAAAAAAADSTTERHLGEASAVSSYSTSADAAAAAHSAAEARTMRPDDAGCQVSKDEWQEADVRRRVPLRPEQDPEIDVDDDDEAVHTTDGNRTRCGDTTVHRHSEAMPAAAAAVADGEGGAPAALTPNPTAPCDAARNGKRRRSMRERNVRTKIAENGSAVPWGGPSLVCFPVFPPAVGTH